MGEWQHILGFLQHDKACAMISVVQVAGSTPREVGAAIVINQKGAFHGTIGGGNMENNSIHAAIKLLEDMPVNYQLKKHVLGPDMGQCCGGNVSVLIEIFTILDIEMVQKFADLEADAQFMILRQFKHGKIIHQLVDDKKQSALGLAKEGDVLMQYGKRNIPVYMFGAGHVGKAIMLQMAALPFDVTWVDNRKNEFPKFTPKNFKMLCVDQPETVLTNAPKEAYILILTHDHGLDFKIAMAALLMHKFSYVGMIGSKTKAARFKSQLKKQGFSQQEMAHLVCPIGIEGIRSKKPVAIAISVVADFLTRITI